MREILLIGATGVFGRRLAGHLARIDTLALTLTSRSLAAAQALVRQLMESGGAQARLTPVALDTKADIGAQLNALSPWLVIDASGPFQSADYRVPQAALAAGAHYIDLADARGFIAGFSAALDTKAKSAGLAALTGVSTTLALSSAVVADVTRGWRRVDTVDATISPAGRTEVGASLIAAILTCAGRPVPVFQDGALSTRAGWTGSSLKTMSGLGRRRASPVETADAELLSARFNVRSRVAFHAALESRIEHFGVAALAHLRRLGWLRYLSGLAPVLLRARRITRLTAGERGGMLVEAAGLGRNGEYVRARWSLVADRGDGPHVPALPALAAVRALLAGAVGPGARPCIDVLELATINSEMRPLAITTSVETADSGPHASIFAEALGDAAYSALPPAIRAFHDADAPPVWRGRADIDAGGGLIGRLLRWCAGLPGAARDVPVTVAVERTGPQSAAGAFAEIWTRDFGGQRFASRLSSGRPGAVVERFGPFAFHLALASDERGLSLPVGSWRFCGVPLPKRLAPGSLSSESADGSGRFRFDVKLTPPLIGMLAHYRGWLTPVWATRGSPSPYLE